MCDLVLHLKDRDMLPCLVFHLNAFEAIKLLQSLLAGLGETYHKPYTSPNTNPTLTQPEPQLQPIPISLSWRD